MSAGSLRAVIRSASTSSSVSGVMLRLRRYGPASAGSSVSAGSLRLLVNLTTTGRGVSAGSLRSLISASASGAVFAGSLSLPIWLLACARRFVCANGLDLLTLRLLTPVFGRSIGSTLRCLRFPCSCSLSSHKWHLLSCVEFGFYMVMLRSLFACASQFGSGSSGEWP